MTEDEILYGKRQSPEVMRQIDQISILVNTKIRQRGIAKGFVCVQEDLNRNLLEIEKLIYWASIEKDNVRRMKYLDKIIMSLKDVGVDIRYMLKNRALTVGEVGEISKYKSQAEKAIYRWRNSTRV
jgi:hypothetical protein